MFSRVARFLEFSFGLHLRRRSQLWAGSDLFVDLSRIADLDTFRVVFDVGANLGHTCAKFRARFPRAVIHAFEPVASNFSQLQDRCVSMRAVHTHPLALSDSTGPRQIHVDQTNTHHSLEHGSGDQTESIITTTLDRFCDEQGIATIDFLKIDTEGHDLAVLRGAEERLKKGAIRALLVESTLDPIDHRFGLFTAFQERLTPLDYQLHSIHEQQIGAKGGVVFFNALFVRTRTPGT